MVDTIEDITINYEEEGVLVTRELAKVILSRGAWTTILFKYQDWDKQKQDYGAIKFSIRRYQKRNNQYQQRSKFNISSVEQAEKIIQTLKEWVAEEGSQTE